MYKINAQLSDYYLVFTLDEIEVSEVQEIMNKPVTKSKEEL